MRNTNYPYQMSVAQMEHGVYMRKREMQADRLVRMLRASVIVTSIAAAVAVGIVIALFTTI